MEETTNEDCKTAAGDGMEEGNYDVAVNETDDEKREDVEIIGNREEETGDRMDRGICDQKERLPLFKRRATIDIEDDD